MAVRLLDTNVFSYIFRGSALGARYKRKLAGYLPALCFMSVAELYEGAYRSKWSPGRFAKLKTFLAGYLIVESSPEICRRWGAVRSERRTQPISVDDAWIAATALEHGLELLTHNRDDFQGIAGLTIISEGP